MKDHYIDVDGITVRYIDEGAGDHTLVLVHGIAGSLNHWEKNIPFLATKARVIAVDLVGYGKTEKPNIAYTHDVFVRFLRNFLDVLKIQQCILIGHSMGGGICLEFAVAYPNRIEKLVLVSSAGFYRKLPLSYRLASVPLISKYLVKVRSPAVMAHLFRHYAHQKDAISSQFVEKARYYLLTTGALKALRDTFHQNINLMGVKGSIIKVIRKNASKLKMPVTIIWGRDDKLLSLKGARQAMKLIPHAKLHIFEECGHMPQLEKPEEFNKIIDALIEV